MASFTVGKWLFPNHNQTGGHCGEKYRRRVGLFPVCFIRGSGREWQVRTFGNCRQFILYLSGFISQDFVSVHAGFLHRDPVWRICSSLCWDDWHMEQNGQYSAGLNQLCEICRHWNLYSGQLSNNLSEQNTKAVLVYRTWNCNYTSTTHRSHTVVWKVEWCKE